MADYRFTLKGFDEIYSLSQRLARFFPNQKDAQIAIFELLINALEHGNLGIGYEAKTQLIAEKRWHTEIAERMAVAREKNKSVDVAVKITDHTCRITITDQGAGFDWKKFLDDAIPSPRQQHGRGLVIAKRCTPEPLHFNDAGNQVVFSMRKAG